MIDTSIIRKRDGQPADESQRPEWVNNHPVLTEIPELGFGDGLPLVGDSYIDYPNGEELMNPGSRSFLVELFSQRLVSSFSDASEELSNTSESQLRNLAELHQIDDAEDLFAEGEPVETMDDEEVPDGCIPLGENGEPVSLDHFRRIPWEDSRLLGELFSLGLGVSGIARFISHYSDHNPNQGDIRNMSQTVGLLDGGSDYDMMTRRAYQEQMQRNAQRQKEQRRKLYSNSEKVHLSKESDGADSGESTPSPSSHSY